MRAREDMREQNLRLKHTVRLDLPIKVQGKASADLIAGKMTAKNPREMVRPYSRIH